ncbi:type III-A CRISPR-associated RAMP protein Csm4 [Desulfonema magnum]|nr:type III-A CRISPR-associated RAMP protein Csm4 [Desulfonema magnum]
MRLVRLRFKTGLHLGADRGGIGREKVQEIVHSDTLFSMLVNSYADIVSGNAEKIASLIDSIETLSSGFLFCEYRRKQFEYYLPRPLTDPVNFSGKHGKENKLRWHKELKRCLYIDRDNFSKWIRGEKISLVKFKNQGYQELFTINIRPQHARDRLTNASNIYHAGEMFFDKTAGIYFLIDGVEQGILKKILDNAAMKGLGGRRSLGYGVFDFEIEPPDDKWKPLFEGSGDNFIIVSLYYPMNLNALSPMAYSLVLRKGWTFSSVALGQFKRETCRMFGEGSIFANKPAGGLVNVAPKAIFSAHPVYRFGKALAFPCTVQETEDDAVLS